MDSKKTLSVVIPCFNEKDNLQELVDRCKELGSNDDVEIILVDNGSTDGSGEVIKSLIVDDPNFKLVSVPVNKGYGFGILSGLRHCSGQVLSWTHADLQTNPNDLLEGFRYFSSESGDIFVKGKRRGRPFSDTVFTWGMSVFETVLLRRWMFDINAQPTMFSKQFYESWDNPPHDFSLDLYAYFKSKRAGLVIIRFPVFFTPRLYGHSKWNLNISSKMKFIARTMKYSFQLRRKI